jgi:hypothetical protein
MKGQFHRAINQLTRSKNKIICWRVARREKKIISRGELCYIKACLSTWQERGFLCAPSIIDDETRGHIMRAFCLSTARERDT